MLYHEEFFLLPHPAPLVLHFYGCFSFVSCRLPRKNAVAQKKEFTNVVRGTTIVVLSRVHKQKVDF